MRKNRIKNFIGVLILLILAWVAYQFGWKSILVGYERDLNTISRGVSTYIKDHEGMFPQSYDKMVEEGYIEIKRNMNGKQVYMIRLSDNIEIGAPRFDQFSINYGVDVKNIEEKNGVLYERHTGNKLMLINGPLDNSVWLRKLYESASLELYQTMNTYSAEN